MTSALKNRISRSCSPKEQKLTKFKKSFAERANINKIQDFVRRKSKYYIYIYIYDLFIGLFILFICICYLYTRCPRGRWNGWLRRQWKIRPFLSRDTSTEHMSFVHLQFHAPYRTLFRSRMKYRAQLHTKPILSK